MILPCWHDVNIVSYIQRIDCGSAKPAFFTRWRRVRAWELARLAIGVGWAGVGNSQLDWTTVQHYTACYLHTTPYQCSLSGPARNGSRYTLDLDIELHTINDPPT